MGVSNNDLAALPTDGWPKSGGNLFNQNYSPLTQINRQTVANVKAVWRTHLGLLLQRVGDGGLVFVGRNDGRLTALNSSTGKRLWEFQTGAGVNAPVSVFEYEGEQYVVAYSGGSLFAGSMRGDSLWLFSLKGTLGNNAG